MYVLGEDITGSAVNVGSQLDKVVVVDERFHLPIVVFALSIYQYVDTVRVAINGAY